MNLGIPSEAALKVASSKTSRYSVMARGALDGSSDLGSGSTRPIAAVRLPSAMLRCGPSDRTFAARAKSVDGRNHTLRTKPTLDFSLSLTQHYLADAASL